MNKMSEPTSVEFVKLEEPTPKKSRASLLIALILVLSFMVNVYFVMLPDINCPEPVLQDECSVNLEATQERVVQCLYQRSLEIASREDAFNECVAELKTTEQELDLYKKDGTDEEIE